MLLKGGASASAIGAGGNTPLHYACDSGALKVTELLIKAGADPALVLRNESRRARHAHLCPCA